ncbi:longevity assurance proteins LAG1/LAC1 [Amylocystis lapponica]|nr:longevity assurance proteins LAG1/LAC1 [Amylocystis lapponica]
MNVLQAPAWLPSLLIPFVTLSYPAAPPAEPDSFPNFSYYVQGPLDGCLVISFIAVMAVLRDMTRLYIMEPFARWKLTRDLRLSKSRKAATRANGNGKANGVANGNGHAAHADPKSITKRESRTLHRSVLRFAEQSWSAISYIVLWSLGLYVHCNVPTTVLHPANLWLNYPHIPLAAPIKVYYLLETAFYVHQILIINAEARRKDHWQMMTHHVITIFLMVGSYSCNYTRVGCLVMTLMDWCDILLPVAKMFRYLSMSTTCDAMFVCFLLSWLITRHWLFILVIASTWASRHTIPHIDEASRRIWYCSVSMLAVLQVIQLMWFWMICRVAWRVVSGQGADDERSEDEGEDGSFEMEKKDQ